MCDPRSTRIGCPAGARGVVEANIDLCIVFDLCELLRGVVCNEREGELGGVASCESSLAKLGVGRYFAYGSKGPLRESGDDRLQTW
jgi:hypothetical protein